MVAYSLVKSTAIKRLATWTPSSLKVANVVRSEVRHVLRSAQLKSLARRQLLLPEVMENLSTSLSSRLNEKLEKPVEEENVARLNRFSQFDLDLFSLPLSLSVGRKSVNESSSESVCIIEW